MSLSDLPNEVVLRISQHVVVSETHLSLWQIAQLALTCGRFRQVCKDRTVWLYVCRVLAAQHEQSWDWHIYVNSYTTGTLQSYWNWKSRFPWKCARLAKRYGDTLLCELDDERVARMFKNIIPRNFLHNNTKFIEFVRRDERGRAVKIKIYAGSFFKARTLRRYESTAQFSWRESKCVPREFWCDSCVVSRRVSVAPLGAPPLLGPRRWLERGTNDNSTNRRAWLKKHTLEIHDQ